jgi:23S rRNA pseudouridine1911/1915/1917 synthase
VAVGRRVEVVMAAPRHTAVKLPDDAIVYADRELVVVEKPAGMPSVPDDTWQRGTLAQVVGLRLRKMGGQRGARQVPLGVVQRLDIDTTGLMVFARTAETHAFLKQQFSARTVKRHYLAIVAGQAQNTTYRSYLTEHKNGKRSSTRHKHLGKFACTKVEVIEQLQGASLVACRLETGRTHQIRIQLSEAGHPLLGDSRYARRRIPTPPAPRVMLHAASLAFDHPSEGTLSFTSPLPADMQAVLSALR